MKIDWRSFMFGAVAGAIVTGILWAIDNARGLA